MTEVDEVVQHVSNDEVTGWKQKFRYKGRGTSSVGWTAMDLLRVNTVQRKKDGQIKKLNRRQISVVNSTSSLH